MSRTDRLVQTEPETFYGSDNDSRVSPSDGTQVQRREKWVEQLAGGETARTSSYRLVYFVLRSVVRERSTSVRVHFKVVRALLARLVDSLRTPVRPLFLIVDPVAHQPK
jgi:hypothetical protein